MSVYNIKRKIQISLRRHIIEECFSHKYFRFFKLGKEDFRQWMEAQFTPDMNWDNYASVWDIDHRIPVCYFDLTDEDDLAVAYHYLNTRPGYVRQNRNKAARIDVGEFRSFFQEAYDRTGVVMGKVLVEKIDAMDFGTERLITQSQVDLINRFEEAERNKPTVEEIVASIIKKNNGKTAA